MTVIQLEIDEKLIHEVGMKTVKDFMESQLSVLRLKYLGQKISETIKFGDFDHEKEVEEARTEAWEEYKEKHTKDLV